MVSILLGIKILNPLSFPRGSVQPRRRENRPSSITRKFVTWGKGAKRQKLVAQRCKVRWSSQQMQISVYSKRCMSCCVTPTCLNGDCGRVSYETWVDRIDSEGIVCFGTQLCHQCCANICLQINLKHKKARRAEVKRWMFEKESVREEGRNSQWQRFL